MAATEIPILLTRPESANDRFVESLRPQVRSALKIIHSPLIRIEALDVKETDRAEAAVFTSAQGVQFAPRGDGQVAFCVGDATAQAASAAGWSAKSVGQDAETLVQALLEIRPDAKLTHYRGTHSRGDVAERLSKAGLTVRSLTVYDQRAMALSSSAKQVLAGSHPVIVPLFSPRTARIFRDQCTPVAPLWVIAMSPAVRETLAEMKPQVSSIASEPTMAAMVREVEKLVPRAPAG